MAATPSAEAMFTLQLQRSGVRMSRALHRPSIAAVQGYIRLISESVRRLNTEARLNEPDAAVVRAGMLHESLLPMLYLRDGRIPEAARLLAGSWAALAGKGVARGAAVRLRPVGVDEADEALLEMFHTVVGEEALAVARTLRPRHLIDRLMSVLRLSFDDMGRVVGVSGETVRRWARGTVGIPEEKLATLDVAGQAVSRLLRVFRPDRLPEVVRRPAEVFNGQRALDWILQGRLTEVADRYERELSYQQ